MRLKKILAAMLTLLFLSSCSKGTPVLPASVPDLPSASSTPSPSPSPSVLPSPSPSPSASPTPIVKEYKGGYLPYALPLSIKYEDGIEAPLYISTDSENFIYCDVYVRDAFSVTADFSGLGTEQTLVFDVSHGSGDNDTSNPTKIDMAICGSTETFESDWNDGIALYVADFNIHDKYKDIIIHQSGTDIDGYFHIYRCDGNTVSYYTGHATQSGDFSFDGRGRIYFAEYLEGYYDEDLERHDGQVITVLDYDNAEYKRFDPKKEVVPFDCCIPRGLPVSIKNEDGIEKPLFLSCYDKNYLDDNELTQTGVRMDFDGDGRVDTLTLEVSHDLEDDGWSNKPIRLKMMIGDSVETIESTWNDGLNLYIVDFNIDDHYMDIFVFESGTDIDGHFSIYRINGDSISYYIGSGTQHSIFTYDGKGKLFIARQLEWYDEATGEYSHVPRITLIDYINCDFIEYNP